jgi:hypothetical protein
MHCRRHPVVVHSKIPYNFRRTHIVGQQYRVHMPRLYPKRSSVVGGRVDDNLLALAAPIAASGDKNVYVTWWSNKTGNDEVMFKASTDSGKTWSNKMNKQLTRCADRGSRE